MKYFNSQRMAHEHEGEERLINRALHEDNHYGVEDDIRDPSLVDLQQVCLKINLCVDVATCHTASSGAATSIPTRFIA